MHTLRRALDYAVVRAATYIVERKTRNLPFRTLYGALVYARNGANKARYVLVLLRSLLPGPSGLNKEKRYPQIIVSLTSYPRRINAAAAVLDTLLRQTCKPDRILLYLAEDQFPDRKLPRRLMRLQAKRGVEIIYCEDLKPHKKYFYAMQKYPEDIIITVDDDIYYDRHLIECLYQSYRSYPDAVSARRARWIGFDGQGRIEPYARWDLARFDAAGQPSVRLCPTGVGGVLYPPHCMHQEVFNEERIKRLCLMADDLWLKVMQVMNNTCVVLAAGSGRLDPVYGTEEESLWKENMYKNDAQLHNILREYNEYFGQDDTLVKRLRDERPPQRNDTVC